MDSKHFPQGVFVLSRLHVSIQKITHHLQKHRVIVLHVHVHCRSKSKCVNGGKLQNITHHCCVFNVLLLTRLLHLQLDGWIFTFLSLEPQHFSFPLSLTSLLFNLLLSLPVDSQQTRTEDVVKTKEDIPVVVHKEQVIGVIRASQLLSCRVAEEELGLGWAAAWQAIVLLGAVLVHLHVFLLLFFLLLHVRELASPREQQVRDEVVDDLLDLVLVFFLDAHLSFDVMDDEGSGVLQDLAVVVGMGHVWAAWWRCGSFL